MYSILVYPNITYAKNLEADSYVVVLRNVIEALNNIRDDLEWTILTPALVKSLEFPNTKQLPISLPTYPNTMRTHFNATQLLKTIDWKHRSYDIVYSHLPEHTLQLKNLFYNTTNERPVFVGYSHWFEVDENTVYSETMFDVNIAGIRAMETCGVNSQWLKDLIVDRVEQTHGGGRDDGCKWIDDMEQKIAVHRLGRQNDDVPIRKLRTAPKYIAFNHRPNKYTGWKPLLTSLDKLWIKRQDWRLMTTMAPEEREYITKIDEPTRGGYMGELSTCTLGIGNFKGYSAWSLSATDGFSVGVPYVLPNGFCYPEMMGDDYPYLFNDDNEMIAMIEELLNDPPARNAASARVKKIADDLDWSNQIKPFNEMIDDAIGKLPMLKKDTDAFKKIIDLARGGATKKQITDSMGWGVGIPWTQYRNRLRLKEIGVEMGVTQYSRV